MPTPRPPTHGTRGYGLKADLVISDGQNAQLRGHWASYQDQVRANIRNGKVQCPLAWNFRHRLPFRSFVFRRPFQGEPDDPVSAARNGRSVWARGCAWDRRGG